MPKPADKTIAHTFRLSPSVLAALREMAGRDQRSMNKQLEHLLRQGLLMWLRSRLQAQGEVARP